MNDEWDGEWFAISKEAVTITNTDTGTPADPVFSIGGNNGTKKSRQQQHTKHYNDLQNYEFPRVYECG